jgi:hypothetical protein
VSNPWADDENKSHAITALPRAVRQQDARWACSAEIARARAVNSRQIQSASITTRHCLFGKAAAVALRLPAAARVAIDHAIGDEIIACTLGKSPDDVIEMQPTAGIVKCRQF